MASTTTIDAANARLTTDKIADANYAKQTWKDGTDEYTPITEARLNHIENGIRKNSELLQELVNVAKENARAIDALRDSLTLAVKYEAIKPSGNYGFFDATVLFSSVTKRLYVYNGSGQYMGAISF